LYAKQDYASLEREVDRATRARISEDVDFMGFFGKKQRLSQHQRQIRFLFGLFLSIIILVTILIFWLVNRQSIIAR
jgi:hypothetical protein